MRTVERLLARSVIELRQVDPASPDAQRCLRAYVAELNRRAPERGFDPSTGATVDPHEVRPPNGRSFSPTFRARRSAAAPSSTNQTTCLTSSACGSRNQREVWGSVAGSSSISGASAVSTHQTKHTRNQQTCCPRGNFALTVLGLRQCCPVQRGTVRRPVVHQAAARTERLVAHAKSRTPISHFARTPIELTSPPLRPLGPAQALKCTQHPLSPMQKPWCTPLSAGRPERPTQSELGLLAPFKVQTGEQSRAPLVRDPYISSGASRPSRSSPWTSTCRVSAHRASRDARVCGSALRTGQFS